MARTTYGDDMGAFLCWLGVRLLEMHRVLRPDGSIYLHIDHTAHAYVKTLMDSIFGKKNFRNEIVWCYTGPSNTKRWFPRKHDTLLYYVKSPDSPFYWEDIRIPYRKLRTGKTSGIFKEDATLDAKGKIPEDYWLEDRDGLTPVGRLAQERTGYPTQKPLALYERIIKASSQAGDWVLDPFCGCATTPVAAERLGRQWIGMDIWDKAHKVVLQRLIQYGLLTEGGPQATYTQQTKLQRANVYYRDTPDERTDENLTPVPYLRTRTRRALEPWQRLSRQQMTTELAVAQAIDGLTGCAGCGRLLELEFMQLDHIQPRADNGVNDISNRILLCGPCNQRKGANFTLRGLRRENRKEIKGKQWMVNEHRAALIQEKAQEAAIHVRDKYDLQTYEGQSLFPA